MISTKQAAWGLRDSHSDANSRVHDGIYLSEQQPSSIDESAIFNESQFHQEGPVRKSVKHIYSNEDEDAILSDWGRAFMLVLCGEFHVQIDRCSVHETTVVEDPTIGLLRRRIQEERKYEVIAEVGWLQIGQKGRNIVVSDPGNAILLGKSGAVIPIHGASSYSAKADDMTASTPVSAAKLKPSDTARYDAQEDMVSQQNEAELVSSSGNIDDHASDDYIEDEADLCGSTSLLCGAIGDWENNNSLQYQFI